MEASFLSAIQSRRRMTHTRGLVRRRPIRTLLSDELLTVHKTRSGLPGRPFRAGKLIPSETSALTPGPPRNDDGVADGGGR